MGIEIGSVKAGWSSAARLCEACKSASATVFCHADAAFLCIPCDARIHSLVSMRHDRVWVCEVCEHAPAAVTCKADAATLCVTCDADIHSANPLARRHERIPVEPFTNSSPAACHFGAAVVDLSGAGQQDDLGACSWLIPIDFNSNNESNMENTTDMKCADFVFSDFDRFIDFEYNQSPFQNPSSDGTDSIVPVQTKPDTVQLINNNNEHCFDIDFCRSKVSSFSSPTTHSLSHSVSSTSLDFGVVPEGSSSMSEISRPPFSLSASSADPSPAVCSAADREARVSRYREKRKNRKFEKTIRYASRKAYAESRPRIKGRFAKRTDGQNEVVYGRIYGSAANNTSTVFIGDVQQYGVVPSF